MSDCGVLKPANVFDIVDVTNSVDVRARIAENVVFDSRRFFALFNSLSSDVSDFHPRRFTKAGCHHHGKTFLSSL